MAKYQEKKVVLVVDILPATKDHVAVLPLSYRADDPTVIGEMFTPDGLVKVYDDDVIVDYGDKTTPRYARLKACDVGVFFEPVDRAKAPALPADSGAAPVAVPEKGGA